MKIETRTEERVVTSTHNVYIAYDGTEFESKTACENYEKDLRKDALERKIAKLRIDKLDGVLPITNNNEWREVDVFWYNVKDDEDYSTIYNYYDLCSNIDYFYEPESYPAIMCVMDNGDYADTYYMNTIIDQVKHFFNLFNMDMNITERG